jgi:hypothetical protein
MENTLGELTGKIIIQTDLYSSSKLMLDVEIMMIILRKMVRKARLLPILPKAVLLLKYRAYSILKCKGSRVPVAK